MITQEKAQSMYSGEIEEIENQLKVLKLKLAERKQVENVDYSDVGDLTLVSKILNQAMMVL